MKSDIPPDVATTRFVQLTERELNEVIEKSVHSALYLIGVENKDPISMQKDFQHLRQSRLTMENVKNKSLLTIIGAIVLGAISLGWMGVKATLSK